MSLDAALNLIKLEVESRLFRKNYQLEPESIPQYILDIRYLLNKAEDFLQTLSKEHVLEYFRQIAGCAALAMMEHGAPEPKRAE